MRLLRNGEQRVCTVAQPSPAQQPSQQPSSQQQQLLTLNFSPASSWFLGFLSGCHLMASFL